MSDPPTLHNLTEIKETGFGQPSPRHGLKLLYWFSAECLNMKKNKMCLKQDPTALVFEKFNNRKDKNGALLLPHVNLAYYMVGNLKRVEANKLPKYVRNDFTRKCDESNMDRIIVSIDKNTRRLIKIYVTQHIYKEKDFSKKDTYCISKELIKTIKGLNKDDFLQKMKMDEATDSNEYIPLMSTTTESKAKPKPQITETEDCCMRCTCVIL